MPAQALEQCPLKQEDHGGDPMRIVSGRGNTRRVVLDVPDGLVVKRSPQNEQKALTEFVCDLIGLQS